MARDYKRTNQARKKRSEGRSLPGWVWGISGLAIGLFVALLVHLNQQNPGGPQSIRDFLEETAGGGGTQSSADDGPGREETADDAKPTFEFYKLLPQQEVVVPDAEPEDETGTPAPEASPQPSPEQPPAESGIHYLLQAGSFQNHKDADRLKAELALLGVEAHIQTVTLQGGETWHRVRIGPFSDQRDLNGVRHRLQTNGVETILLKRKS
ncbi:SPOR domain-containing protein [Ectothiorhodospiraceae bacterium WFHF3C12]|nr:SPOR domain-containing protein [Ectothiorhodospiraceae bacterium WFHF3C12]